MKPVIYEKRGGAEIVRYECAAQSYPAHTHASHVTFGRVTGGAVRVIIGGRARLCRAGDVFCIPPDVPHALEAVGGSPYSMTVACVPVRERPCDGGEPFTRTLKRWAARITCRAMRICFLLQQKRRLTPPFRSPNRSY